MREGISSGATCLACHAMTIILKSRFVSREAISTSIKQVCVTFRLAPREVCEGIVESYKVRSN